MLETQTNLQVLKPSRKKRRPGDVFVYQMPDRQFRFGRLISTKATIGGFPANLVYLYKAESDKKLPVPDLSPSHLLIPPLGTNQKPWTLGYFELVESRPLVEADTLSTHCSRDSRGSYFDERGAWAGVPAILDFSIPLALSASLVTQALNSLGITLLVAFRSSEPKQAA